MIDESCGLVVEKGNVDAVATAIYRLAEGSTEVEQLLKNAQSFAQEVRFEGFVSVYIQGNFNTTY